MKVEREYLSKIVNDEGAVDFAEKIFTEPNQFDFLDKLNKNIKKQIKTAVNFEKFADGVMSDDDFMKSLEGTGKFSTKSKGYFIKGNITHENLHHIIAFLGCNNNPKQDTVNNSLIYFSKNYRLFVEKSNYDSENKNIAFLYVYETPEEVNGLFNTYFSSVEEMKEMNEEDILKLSYDITDFPYSDTQKDYASNYDMLAIQNALYSTYSQNPFDFIGTLALLYRLKALGWDKNYIMFASDSGKAFNVLGSSANIKINKVKIQSLIDTKFVDDNLDLTESGRTAMSLLNYFSPMSSNNLGNYYASMSYYASISGIDKNNFVSVTTENSVLFGIKDEFYVCEDCLGNFPKTAFTDDSQFKNSFLNSINSMERAREIGYAPNLQLDSSETIDINICQPLFNTFRSEELETIGGLIMIKTYNSKEPIFVNSLIFKLIKRSFYNISPFVSNVNNDYIIFKNNENDKIVGIIKTKNFSCQKEIMGTQDRLALLKKATNYFNDKLYKGLELNENRPVILGVGYIEKAQLSIEDFNSLLKVSFRELKTIVRDINKSSYYNELNEMEIIQRIIEERKSEYADFVNSVKEAMGERLKGLEIIYNYFVELGNQEKQSYYSDVIASYKSKIDSFVI